MSSPSTSLKYRRVLLKLSGEALMGDEAYGIDPKVIDRLAGEIAELCKQGAEIAIVIGGGISGLATANALTRKGKKVYLIERSPRLGGSVRTDMKDGYLCEAGPNSMLVKSESVWNYLIDDLGLKDTMVMANEISNKRFLVKNGRMVALPQSIAGGITTPLYSLPEKMRLLLEPFIRPTQLEDESVTSFVSRRMGKAFLEYGISALVSGIYAGNPDNLSLRHAFGKVWNLEQTYGSMIGGAIKLKFDTNKSGGCLQNVAAGLLADFACADYVRIVEQVLLKEFTCRN